MLPKTLGDQLIEAGGKFMKPLDIIPSGWRKFRPPTADPTCLGVNQFDSQALLAFVNLVLGPPIGNTHSCSGCRNRAGVSDRLE